MGNSRYVCREFSDSSMCNPQNLLGADIDITCSSFTSSLIPHFGQRVRVIQTETKMDIPNPRRILVIGHPDCGMLDLLTGQRKVSTFSLPLNPQELSMQSSSLNHVLNSLKDVHKVAEMT